jgi:hypothetical protein
LKERKDEIRKVSRLWRARTSVSDWDGREASRREKDAKRKRGTMYRAPTGETGRLVLKVTAESKV